MDTPPTTDWIIAAVQARRSDTAFMERLARAIAQTNMPIGTDDPTLIALGARPLTTDDLVPIVEPGTTAIEGWGISTAAVVPRTAPRPPNQWKHAFSIDTGDDLMFEVSICTICGALISSAHSGQHEPCPTTRTT